MASNKARSLISAIRVISLFPPQIRQTTFFPLISSVIIFNDAVDIAPAGSTTMASLLYNLRIDWQIFPSDTSTSLSKKVVHNVNASSPTFRTAAPSTKGSISLSSVILPLASDCCMAGAPSGSIPITLVWGESVLNTCKTPEISPPPPIGTRI